MTLRYIGTKEVVAWPQSKPHPIADCPAMAGYAVKYPDGYTSWSPLEAFEKAYRISEGDGQALTFGDALHYLKLGKKVARAGWNGKNMWLRLFVPFMDKQFQISEREPDPAIGDSGTLVPWIGMHTADNKFVPWLCSQTDALASDWCVLP